MKFWKKKKKILPEVNTQKWHKILGPFNSWLYTKSSSSKYIYNTTGEVKTESNHLWGNLPLSSVNKPTCSYFKW